jgi:Methyltransferase domain
LSQNHTVFAVDAGNKSISSVNSHSLFNSDTVEFIEGPSQRTLPQYQFNHKLQIALIDGPHGYPFPDLEYYYLYPHIEVGGLLLIDDIHIPTIRNLFNFLKEEEMFELVEVVQQTAFFRRTTAELFNPLGDGWWLQKYNKVRFPLSLNQPNPQKLKARLHQTKAELNKTRSELERVKNRLSAMESSKFWRLRTAWFTLKQKLGLTDSRRDEI